MAIRRDLEEAEALAAAAVAATSLEAMEAMAATAEAAAMPEGEGAGGIGEHPIRPGDTALTAKIQARGDDNDPYQPRHYGRGSYR